MILTIVSLGLLYQQQALEYQLSRSNRNLEEALSDLENAKEKGRHLETRSEDMSVELKKKIETLTTDHTAKTNELTECAASRQEKSRRIEDLEKEVASLEEDSTRRLGNMENQVKVQIKNWELCQGESETTQKLLQAAEGDLATLRAELELERRVRQKLGTENDIIKADLSKIQKKYNEILKKLHSELDEGLEKSHV